FLQERKRIECRQFLCPKLQSFRTVLSAMAGQAYFKNRLILTIMKHFILLALFFSAFHVNGQIIYIDVLKAEMIRLHGEKVQDGVEETGKSLSDIKAKGLYVQTKLNAIKQSHAKLQKGLQDVS